MKCAYHTKWCDKWNCEDANHPNDSVISTPIVPFITPSGKVCPPQWGARRQDACVNQTRTFFLPPQIKTEKAVWPRETRTDSDDPEKM